MQRTVRLEARTGAGTVKATEPAAFSRPAVVSTLGGIGLMLAKAATLLARLQASRLCGHPTGSFGLTGGCCPGDVAGWHRSPDMGIDALFGFFGRAAATALVVVMASVIAEAAGPVLGALAASLPVSAGPTYVFLALTHDTSFVSASALGSFAANAATIVFLATYARIAVGRARLAALLPAVLVWLLMSLLINSVRWTSLSALALNGGVLAAGVLATRRTARSDQPAASAARATRRDLAGRALAVALFVASLLALSAALGPGATGILATFPIVFVVLIFVLRPRIGDAACAVLAATALRAMGGFGLMFLVVHLAVVPLGAATGLALALLPTLAWSAALAYQHGRTREAAA